MCSNIIFFLKKMDWFREPFLRRDMHVFVLKIHKSNENNFLGVVYHLVYVINVLKTFKGE